MSEEQELPKPKDGYELAKMLQCAPDEGVIVAVLTGTINETWTKEIPVLDKRGDHMHAVVAELPHWGRRLMDIASENGERVKWWRVTEAAKAEGIQEVPVRWRGLIGEIPDRYFEEGSFTAIRFYGHGPWFFPLERPVTLPTEEEKALTAAVDGGAE